MSRRPQQRRRSKLACAALHGATNVRVFGSTARGEDRPDSDLDLVVDLEEGTGLFALEAMSRSGRNSTPGTSHKDSYAPANAMGDRRGSSAFRAAVSGAGWR
ncbi:MAG: nucleotidyltransferase domain-containing protein [Actinomycetota bacterium]|nr:nucleotidyltransferase domain-containing protein [Actinomycetota bacterium]